MSKKIIWFCWPERFKKSWVWNYSNIYIQWLKNKWYNIFDKRIKVKNNYIRLFTQFFVFPIQAITKYRNKTKVFWDEWMLLYTLFPFFPYKNSIFIVHDIRNFDNSTKNKTILQKLYFYFVWKSLKNLKNAKTIVTPSEFTKNKIIETFWVEWDKIHIIYNSIDTDVFKVIKWINKKELLESYWIKTDKKVLLNVWSEESRKNIMTILKTMKQLDDYVFIKIWRPIIKQNREEHLKFIKDNKLDNKVYFIDFVETNEDLVKFYNIADIFVFPSLFEWFWRPPIEAQACWCPVISSDKWWLKEVLLDSAVILQNPESVDELTEKIQNNWNFSNEIIESWLKNTQRFSLKNNVWKWKFLSLIVKNNY